MHTHTHCAVVERPSVTIGETTSYNPTIGTFGDSGTPDNVSKCLQQNQLPAGELSLSLSLTHLSFISFHFSFCVYNTGLCLVSGGGGGSTVYLSAV